MSSYRYDCETATAGMGESGSNMVADRPRALGGQRAHADAPSAPDRSERSSETVAHTDSAANTGPRVGDSRDEAATRRDLAADSRDRAGALQDLIADQRDQAARRRDETADLRDQTATQRDFEAARREQRQVERSESPSVSPTAEAFDRRKTDSAGFTWSPAITRAAANDRADAAFDRQRGADERADAAEDRRVASTARRGHATERLAAAQDRRSSQSDRRAAAAERERAIIDELTGVLMRRAGFEALEREMVRARRIGMPLIVGFFDVDHLKLVNDTLGHAAGDQVLMRIADALRANLRSCDLVIRYGGDEFVCVLTGLEMDAASVRFESVAQTLSEDSDQASVTVGVAQMRRGETAADVVARADQALYLVRQKERGLPQHRIDRTA